MRIFHQPRSCINKIPGQIQEQSNPGQIRLYPAKSYPSRFLVTFIDSVNAMTAALNRECIRNGAPVTDVML